MTLAEVPSSARLMYIGRSSVMHFCCRATLRNLSRDFAILSSQNASLSFPDHWNHPTRGPKTFPSSCGQAESSRLTPLKASLWNGQISYETRIPWFSARKDDNIYEMSESYIYLAMLDGSVLPLLLLLPRPWGYGCKWSPWYLPFALWRREDWEGILVKSQSC